MQPQVEAHAVYTPHLFVDQINAPADVVAHTILKVVEEVAAKYIVLAKSNKVQPAQTVRMAHAFDAEQVSAVAVWTSFSAALLLWLLRLLSVGYRIMH